MTEPVYIVCNLVADGPAATPGAEERWCNVCAAGVWLAPSSLAFMDKTGALPLCVECALGMAALEAEEPEIGSVPGTEAQSEMDAAGMSNTDKLRALAWYRRHYRDRRNGT